MFRLDPLRTHRIRSYARQSGKSASTVVNETLDHWYDTYGEAILDEMIKRNSRKRSMK